MRDVTSGTFLKALLTISGGGACGVAASGVQESMVSTRRKDNAGD
jgi:hypothetical protein